MDYQLNLDHPLWRELTGRNPQWWQNLKSDPDIYCDIRKDNYLNFYCNGGSLMRLRWDNGFKAEIHCEYIPLKADRVYLPYAFDDGDAQLTSPGIIDIQNFAAAPLIRIKKRIKKFYPNNSEKGIQGHYVTRSLQAKRRTGYFIDTEFEFQGKRMDLVWVDVKMKKIAFVELKRVSDAGLFAKSAPNCQSIDDQLKKYAAFITNNRSDLLAYYDLVFRIKKKLGLLKGFAKYKSLASFELLGKPILLVGDCTQEWIDEHALQINAKVAQHAFGCVYQGPSTFTFRIPFETAGNSYRIAGPTSKPVQRSNRSIAPEAEEPRETAGSRDGQVGYNATGLKPYRLTSVTPEHMELERQDALHKIYPELALGAETPAGPLGLIKLRFAESFAHWKISLPEENVVNRRRGKIREAGWAIWYLFDSDEKGEYLDYYSAHRMTNDSHTRIYEDGQVECLPAIKSIFIGSGDPDQDVRLREEQHAEDLRVAALLEAKGFGIEGDEPVSVQIQRDQCLQDEET